MIHIELRLSDVSSSSCSTESCQKQFHSMVNLVFACQYEQIVKTVYDTFHILDKLRHSKPWEYEKY